MGSRTKGKCYLCDGIFGKRAMNNHFDSCEKREVDEPESKRDLQNKDVFRIVVEGHCVPDYWLYLEIPSDSRLKDLDNFLRDIWLECCGHMSAFTIGGKTYSVAPMAEFDDESMGARLDEVLSPGMKFHYEYDFGSTTHLALRVVCQEQKQIKDKSIAVLARNEPPSISCVSCGKIAAQVCTECLWSDSGGWLCDECAAEHECSEEMLLPVVNSPRVGVCGYTGQ